VCAPGTSFYYIQGSVQGGSGIGTIATYDVSTGISTTVFQPPPRPNGLQNINGIGSDPSRGIIYFQDSSDTAGAARGIYYYQVITPTFGTITSDASGSPLNITPLTNGWQTASGSFANGKYYAGVDGGDVGTTYEISLDASGTVPVGAARPLFTPNSGCGAGTCQNYGDILVNGNRMYVALWITSPETQILDVWDINSGIRLSRWTNGATGFALQLAQDGNGQIYAITSNNGRVFNVTNGGVVQNFPGTPVRTIGSVVHDAAECVIAPMDFGDAPNSYGTDVGPRAARHGLTNNLRLGNVSGIPTVRDLHGFSSIAANGDDTHNYNGGPNGGTNDEDSVSTILPALDTNTTSYTLPNIVVYNNTGANATLYGWIDFNIDGQFAQSERATTVVSPGASNQTVSLTWSGLSGLRAGQTYLRLRLSTSNVTTSALGTGNDGAFLATGYAPDGEVEDYPVSIGFPTAVILTSQGTRSTSDNTATRVMVEWTTATELNTAGFNVYRSERAEGPYVRINPQLIPASDRPLVGGKYKYEDANVVAGKTYYYQLEDLTLNGTSTQHEPVEVTVSSTEGRIPGTTLLLWLAAAVTLLGGGMYLRRRKGARS
jgi:hypothetical protein